MQGTTLQYCRPKKVQLVTLGCSKNRVDSEHLLRQMESVGVEIADSGFELSSKNRIDAVILNTCGFIKDAKEESIEAILQAVEAKELGYVKQVFVFGCLSQRYKNDLEKEIPEVDGFFGAFDWDSILNALGITKDDSLLQQRYLTTPKHYAYLKISEGCDRTCSYCAIPGIRGKHISVPMEELVEEARHLAAKGVRELIVIAQDTTYYGLDLYKRRALGDLLKQLCEIDGIEWIRIHYSYPDQFPDDVLEIMATNPKICKYIDIPLQHSSTKLLKMMRRSIDGPQTQAVLDRIKEKVPGIVVRTTFIVGHPGEDRREFEKLLRFVERNRFDRLGAFTYSEEEGTYGALHFKDTVRESTKQARYEELMELQSGISLSSNEARVGNVERVIVDSFTDGVLVCRSQSESPEVDGEILIGKKGLGEFAPEELIGKFVKAKIAGANEYDLLAELVEVEK